MDGGKLVTAGTDWKDVHVHVHVYVDVISPLQTGGNTDHNTGH